MTAFTVGTPEIESFGEYMSALRSKLPTRTVTQSSSPSSFVNLDNSTFSEDASVSSTPSEQIIDSSKSPKGKQVNEKLSEISRTIARISQDSRDANEHLSNITGSALDRMAAAMEKMAEHILQPAAPAATPSLPLNLDPSGLQFMMAIQSALQGQFVNMGVQTSGAHFSAAPSRVTPMPPELTPAENRGTGPSIAEEFDGPSPKIPKLAEGTIPGSRVRRGATPAPGSFSDFK